MKKSGQAEGQESPQAWQIGKNNVHMTGVEIKGSHTGGSEKGRKVKSSNLDHSSKGEEEKDGFVKYLGG